MPAGGYADFVCARSERDEVFTQVAPPPPAAWTQSQGALDIAAATLKLAEEQSALNAKLVDNTESTYSKAHITFKVGATLRFEKETEADLGDLDLWCREFRRVAAYATNGETTPKKQIADL
jgi:hypothetical protein